MPIDFYSSIKKTSQFVFSSNILNSLLGSSLMVSIIIAIVLVMIIMFIYPAKRGTPTSVLIRLFIYTFLSTLLLVFLHDGIIKYMYRDEMEDKTQMDFMRGTSPGNKDVVYGQKIPITPFTGGDPDAQILEKIANHPSNAQHREGANLKPKSDPNVKVQAAPYDPSIFTPPTAEKIGGSDEKPRPPRPNTYSYNPIAFDPLDTYS